MCNRCQTTSLCLDPTRDRDCSSLPDPKYPRSAIAPEPPAVSCQNSAGYFPSRGICKEEPLPLTHSQSAPFHCHEAATPFPRISGSARRPMPPHRPRKQVHWPILLLLFSRSNMQKAATFPTWSPGIGSELKASAQESAIINLGRDPA